MNLIEISQGNSRILKFGPVLDPNKVPVDLTGATAVWRMARAPDSKLVDVFRTKTTEDNVNPITIVNAVVGSVTQWFVWVRLVRDDTKDIPPSVNPSRWWWMELQITDSAGNVDTAYRGPIILLPSIDNS